MHHHLIKRTLVTIAALTIATFAILLIPNLPIFDEALLPEIQQRLSTPANPVIEGNAIYALYGLSAASGKDAVAVGKATIKALQAKHANGEFANLDTPEQLALYGGDQTEDKHWQANYPATTCRARENINCLGELLAQIDSKPISDTRLLEQLQRYNSIIASSHIIEFTSNMDYTSPMPSYGIAMQLDKLRQANAYKTSGLDGLISSSQTSMAFWRMSLRESQTTIGKMVTIAILRENLQNLSYAIAKTHTLSDTQMEQVRALTQPLTQDEINIEEVFTNELRFGVEDWKTAPKGVPEGGSIWLWLLSQPHASSNWFYRQTLKPAFDASRMSPIEFYQRAQAPVKALTFSRINPYNLGGKIQLAENWQLAPYQGRAHDLAGIYKMLALQIALKNISQQDWPAAIGNSDFENPYTESAFTYDPARKSLSFNCFDTKDVCALNL